MVDVERLPVCVEHVIRAPGTGEQQGVAGKTRQGIAVATIGGETDSETLRPGGPVDRRSGLCRPDRPGLPSGYSASPAAASAPAWR